jgi:hypothetical protein
MAYYEATSSTQMSLIKLNYLHECANIVKKTAKQFNGCQNILQKMPFWQKTMSL